MVVGVELEMEEVVVGLGEEGEVEVEVAVGVEYVALCEGHAGGWIPRLLVDRKGIGAVPRDLWSALVGWRSVRRTICT